MAIAYIPPCNLIECAREESPLEIHGVVAEALLLSAGITLILIPLSLQYLSYVPIQYLYLIEVIVPFSVFALPFLDQNPFFLHSSMRGAYSFYLVLISPIWRLR